MKVEFRGKTWVWNQEDVKLLQVNSWLSDLQFALDVVDNANEAVAVQAGGAMGLWPWLMAQRFKNVYTFEPNKDNFECLIANCMDCNNVWPIRGGLSDRNGYGEVKLPKSEQNNAGAYYLAQAAEGIPAGDGVEAAPIFTIDTLRENGELGGRVGLIQLDIEGLELKALQGAVRTISENWPVIMVEDKPLPQDHETGHVVGAVSKWLCQTMGYKLHKAVHRDLIFVPNKKQGAV